MSFLRSKKGISENIIWWIISIVIVVAVSFAIRNIVKQ